MPSTAPRQRAQGPHAARTCRAPAMCGMRRHRRPPQSPPSPATSAGLAGISAGRDSDDDAEDGDFQASGSSSEGESSSDDEEEGGAQLVDEEDVKVTKKAKTSEGKPKKAAAEGGRVLLGARTTGWPLWTALLTGGPPVPMPCLLLAHRPPSAVSLRSGRGQEAEEETREEGPRRTQACHHRLLLLLAGSPRGEWRGRGRGARQASIAVTTRLCPVPPQAQMYCPGALAAPR
jgi:hypothetical protein